jgi:hypothetical protein
MVIEEHKKDLMQFMILYELGLATREVHLATAVIVYLHLIWSSSTRFFAENGFMVLSKL